MRPAALLDELRHRGIHIEVDGETLRYRAPRGQLTPELRLAIGSQKAALLELLKPHPEQGWAIRLFSRILDQEIWLVEDDAEAFVDQLRWEGDARPVFTVAEVLILENMLEADAREILRALAKSRSISSGPSMHPVSRSEDA